MGLILLVIYINDLADFCNNGGKLFLFANDAKPFKHIQSIHYSYLLNKYSQNLFSWNEKLLTKLNIDKCKIVTITQSKNFVCYKCNFDTKNVGLVD